MKREKRNGEKEQQTKTQSKTQEKNPNISIITVEVNDYIYLF